MPNAQHIHTCSVYTSCKSGRTQYWVGRVRPSGCEWEQTTWIPFFTFGFSLFLVFSGFSVVCSIQRKRIRINRKEKERVREMNSEKGNMCMCVRVCMHECMMNQQIVLVNELYLSFGLFITALVSYFFLWCQLVFFQQQYQFILQLKNCK